MSMIIPTDESKTNVNGHSAAFSFKYLRIKSVCELTGLSKTTVYEYSKTEPEFPKPVKLGANCTAWRSDELNAWMMSRPRVALVGGEA